ncbi:YceD family protein [Endothiovibrio diazotrophicus]
MFEPLPERLDLLRDASRGRAFRGRIPLDRMARLRVAAVDAVGDAVVEFALDRDGAGRPFMKGTVAAAVALTCQRCLQPVMLELEAVFSLGLVRGEQEAERLPEEYEPLLVAPEPMELAPLIEDELLLALPAVARHDTCSMGYSPEPAAEPEEAPPRENPFAALSALKREAPDEGGSDR